jgi:hypothetical protein
MTTRHRLQPRRITWVASFAILAVLLVTGCDEARTSPRPSSSLLEVQFTPQPSSTASATGQPTTQPTFVSLPVGWDNAFCGVFADTVVAQELVIDIERALDEENVKDAKGLARELRDTTADATALLADLPDWDPAQGATLEIATLIDLGGRAGTEYGTFFTDESRNALRRARALRKEIENETPAANEALAGLADLGIECEGFPLVLEKP